MIGRKTERIYESAPLNGDDVEHAVESFSIALHRLRAKALLEKREALFDTLEVEVVREADTDVIAVGAGMDLTDTHVSITIQVSLEAVRR